jgi:L-threonylcarbamoyladenylate synthase
LRAGLDDTEEDGMTSRLRVDPASCHAADLAPAVEWLRVGGVVAFPTDTVYGLAVDPCNATAVQHLFDLKGRSLSAAVPLLAASIDQVESFCGRLDDRSARLARTFWPGPLALIVNAPAAVHPRVHAGRRTLAIRVPDHAVARGLAGAWGGPVTATSANRSGALPAASVEMLDDLASDSRVLVIDGGAVTGGAPSTIVDARGAAPLLVREGAVPWKRVLESLQE